MSKGFDAWGLGPTPSAALAAGYQWRTWYSSNTPSKDAPPGGVAAYSEAGFWNVVNFETTTSRMYSGSAAGAADMQHAIAEYVPQGMPFGAAVILSADADVPVADLAEVLPYYQGATQAANGNYLVGAYGEQALIQYLKLNSAISLGWKSMSSSFPGNGGSTYCDLVQVGGATIGGVSVDHDEAMVDFFGAWKPGLLQPGKSGVTANPIPSPIKIGTPPAQRNTYTPVSVDGDFGPATIKATQFVEQVSVDGQWGLESKKGLQRHLNVADDGQIGPVTILALQKRVGAQQDKVWGPGTTTDLQKALNAGKF